MTGAATGGGGDASDGRAPGGEAHIIQRYFAPLAAAAPGALGLTDDCALLSPTPGHDLVVTTDAIAAGVHFFADDAARDIGWKALAVNVSDLAAKGARPIAYLLALAMPDAPTAAWMGDLAAGLGEAQRAFGCHLLGGDTDRRPGPLSLTITAIGEVPAGSMVRRATARVGDDIYVTGTLGDAALGLMLRQTPALAAAWGLDGDQVGALVARYLRPRPRVLGAVLRDHASAAMDISDGLAKDLGRMAAASGVGARVEAARLPLSAPAGHVLARVGTLVDRALAGGDDYELLIAVPPANESRFIAAAAAVGVAVTRIGAMTESRDIVVLDVERRRIQLARDGWDHF